MMTMGKRRELQVSRHGERRARQRVGLPKKSVERNAQRALTEGIGYREASGALRRYISWLYELYDGNGNNIRIYGDKVWIFHDAILITVLNVPSEHRKAAIYQQERRRNEHG
jgi:nuclear transport factor 2 (NTF2) superfamily protein